MQFPSVFDVLPHQGIPGTTDIEFPFPFTEFQSLDDNGDQALTLVELRMIALSYALRGKPSWWTKVKNPEIRSKWKAEALAQEIQGGTLSEAEVEWVLDELEDYATMRDETTGIQPSCHVRIWESDELVSPELNSRLRSAASVLGNVPEEEKDWHPRSNEQVLDLVHPSLFCIVYGRTQYWITRNGTQTLRTLQPPDGDLEGWAYSDDFSWIPTDFQLGEGGVPAKALGYINNVHPEKHKDLIPVIEALVGRFSLLWDKVLTDIHPDNNKTLPGRDKMDGAYEWTDHPDYPRPDWSRMGELGQQEFYRLMDVSRAHQVLIMPTVDERGYRKTREELSSRDVTYSIQGRKVQVIVKLANIHLTPEKPEYSGGTWHVEGMANERIVASGIYYYDSENITDSRLSFRVSVNFAEAPYQQSDHRAIELIWGMRHDEDSNQVVGAVKTSVNRCIAFPNIYQHQVSPFELVDRSRPGHRKILALFLVDPEQRTPSTANIPPQQDHWIRPEVHNILAQNEARTKVALPAEVVDMMVDKMDNLMTLEEAKAYRESLMNERTAFVDVVDKHHFCTQFNFCEH